MGIQNLRGYKISCDTGTEHAVGWRSCDSNSPVVVGDPAGLAWKISCSSRIRSARRIGTSTTLVETD